MDTPQGTTLATCPHFHTTLHHLAPGETIANPTLGRFSLITVVNGCLENQHSTGDTVLLPQNAAPLAATSETSLLQITIPA